MSRRPHRREPPRDHDGVVADWRENASSRDDDNYQFLRSLKFHRRPAKVDATAAAAHREAFEIVDCTRCANCCRTMTVVLERADIERIAGHLGLPAEEFISTYLAADDEEPGKWQIRQQPCPFLGTDNRCTIYEVRPRVCREYPFTDKKGFATRTIVHANNALNCPAVYWIVEQLRLRVPR